MKRIDDDYEGESWLKAAIYGPPGTGKTDFAVSAPKPLILLSERQGLATIRAAAKRRGVPLPRVFFMETLSDLRDMLRALHGPKDKPFRVVQTLNVVVRDEAGKPVKGADGKSERKQEKVTIYEGEWPETVVIDSITDACELVEEEIRREAPPEKAKDGLEKWTERHWSALRDRSEKLIRSFRDAPVHVLFLALQDDRTVGEGDEASRVINPMLPMRALPGFLCSCVNVVGVTSRRIDERDETGQKQVVYEIRTVAASHYMLKPYRPLRDLEEPDFAGWVARTRDAQAAPVPEPEPVAAPETSVSTTDQASPQPVATTPLDGASVQSGGAA